MHIHRNEAFEPVGHRRDLDPHQIFGNRLDHLPRRFHCRLVLPEKHRAVELEVVVVRSIKRVEVHPAFEVVELPVGRDAIGVGFDNVVVVTAKDVDVRRHVLEVAPIRHQVAQHIAGLVAPAPDAATSPSDARIGAARRDAANPRGSPTRVLQHLGRFVRVGVIGRRAGL